MVRDRGSSAGHARSCKPLTLSDSWHCATRWGARKHRAGRAPDASTSMVVAKIYDAPFRYTQTGPPLTATRGCAPHASACCGSQCPNARDQRCMRGPIDRLVRRLCARRELRPLALWPNRPRTKIAAAVRTDTLQPQPTFAAERTLERTDQRLLRTRRKRPLTVLTRWPKLEHSPQLRLPAPTPQHHVSEKQTRSNRQGTPEERRRAPEEPEMLRCFNSYVCVQAAEHLRSRGVLRRSLPFLGD